MFEWSFSVFEKLEEELKSETFDLKTLIFLHSKLIDQRVINIQYLAYSVSTFNDSRKKRNFTHVDVGLCSTKQLNESDKSNTRILRQPPNVEIFWFYPK